MDKNESNNDSRSEKSTPGTLHTTGGLLHLAFCLRLRVSTLKHHGIYGENTHHTKK